MVKKKQKQTKEQRTIVDKEQKQTKEQRVQSGKYNSIEKAISAVLDLFEFKRTTATQVAEFYNAKHLKEVLWRNNQAKPENMPLDMEYKTFLAINKAFLEHFDELDEYLQNPNLLLMTRDRFVDPRFNGKVDYSKAKDFLKESGGKWKIEDMEGLKAYLHTKAQKTPSYYIMTLDPQEPTGGDALPDGSTPNILLEMGIEWGILKTPMSLLQLKENDPKKARSKKARDNFFRTVDFLRLISDALYRVSVREKRRGGIDKETFKGNNGEFWLDTDTLTQWQAPNSFQKSVFGQPVREAESILVDAQNQDKDKAEKINAGSYGTEVARQDEHGLRYNFEPNADGQQELIDKNGRTYTEIQKYNEWREAVNNFDPCVDRFLKRNCGNNPNKNFERVSTEEIMRHNQFYNEKAEQNHNSLPTRYAKDATRWAKLFVAQPRIGIVGYDKKTKQKTYTVFQKYNIKITEDGKWLLDLHYTSEYASWAFGQRDEKGRLLKNSEPEVQAYFPSELDKFTKADWKDFAKTVMLYFFRYPDPKRVTKPETLSNCDHYISHMDSTVEGKSYKVPFFFLLSIWDMSDRNKRKTAKKLANKLLTRMQDEMHLITYRAYKSGGKEMVEITPAEKICKWYRTKQQKKTEQAIVKANSTQRQKDLETLITQYKRKYKGTKDESKVELFVAEDLELLPDRRNASKDALVAELHSYRLKTNAKEISDLLHLTIRQKIAENSQK